MKLNNKKTTLNSLVTAIAALGFISVPVIHAETTGSATDTNRGGTGTNQGGAGSSGASQGGTGANRSGLDTNQGGTGANRSGNEANRIPLTTEVTETFVEGYTVPAQYRTRFTELPTNKEENTVVRYHKGRAFYVNKNDWKIQKVVELDSSIEEEDSSMVQGSTIPENLRTRFVELPKPEEGVSIRYHDNTAYYMDSDFKIVRKVDLTR
jgi:hypothetical protein